jgi:hypothetical protein
MHPDLISALVRERRTELLRHQHFQENRRGRSRPLWQQRQRPDQRLRRTVGVALVHAGTRLMPPTAK